MKLTLQIAAWTLLALAPSEPCFGKMMAINDEAAEAQRLLKQAEDLTNIRSSGTHSFSLVARVQFYVGKELAAEGTYTLAWESPTVWRDEIKFADYSQVRVAMVDKLFISRNPPTLPFEIFRLLELLDFPQVLHPATNTKPGKVKERTRNGSRERTVEIGSWIVSLDKSSPIPTRVEYEDFHFGYQFEDYASFDAHQFPRTLTEFASNGPLIQVQVQELAKATFDASSFTPPKDAGVVRWCPHPEPARLVVRAKLDPMPSQLRDIAQQHAVAIYGIIGTDGRWNNLALVKSANKEVDSYWMNQQLQERYSPAKCGGVPVEQESVKEHHYQVLEGLIVPH